MKMQRIVAGVLIGFLGGVRGVEARQVVEAPIPWVIESADYAGTVTEHIARLQATFTVRLMQDGAVQIPLPLAGATITKIECTPHANDTAFVPRGDHYALAVSRKGTYKVKIDFSTRLIQGNQDEGLAFGIPAASFSTLALIVPRKDVELREAEQLYIERHADAKSGGVRLIARLASAERVDIRWLTKPVTPVQIEPMLYGEVHTLVRLEDQLAHIGSVIEYAISQGEVRELTVRLPKTIQVLNVRGAGIEDWHLIDENELRTLHVKLNFALKDATYQLVVEGEQTLLADQPAYQLPEVTLVGVKQERGQVGVASEGSLEVATQAFEGLTRIDTKELAATLQTATTTPIVLAFRYHHHPYQVSLTMTHHKDLPVLNAIAEQGELTTIMSRQGELLTRAAYAIRTNKKQFLGVTLPKGATLWSCLVNGHSVKPVEGPDGQQLVPMATTNASDQAIIVEMVYFERRPELPRIGQVTLHGPLLDVPTTIANWLVYAPNSMQFLRISGNVDRGASFAEFVDEPLTPVAYAATSPIPTEGWKVNERVRGASLASRMSASREDPKDEDKEDRPALKNFWEKGRDALAAGLGGQAKRRAAVADQRQLDLVTNASVAMQESGILPLKIRVPKAGATHHFSRLMTTQEALELNVLFVNLPMSGMLFGSLGLLFISLGVVTRVRIRKG